MDSENQQITLRDTIANALDKHTSEEAQTEVAQVQDSKPRDEQGRFAPKQEATEQVEVQTEEKPVKPRPSSWGKKYEEHWSRLDPQLQDYLAQREADYAKGVSQYKQNWDNAAPLYEAIQQFMPDLQANNINPAQWITNLGIAHKTLASGSPEQKLEMFARLANDYGVNLNVLNGQQQYDPQFSAITQELNSIKTKLSSFEEQRIAQENASLQNDIEAFKKDAPYFEDVRETMATLLQSGVASDLKTAYDKAIRLNDDVWQRYQEEAQQAKSQSLNEQKQQKAAEAKAKAVSVKSSSPTGMMVGSGNGKKDLRSTVAELVNANLTERV